MIITQSCFLLKNNELDLIYTGLTLTPSSQIINNQIKPLVLEMWQSEINLMTRRERERNWRERERERARHRVTGFMLLRLHEEGAPNWKLLSVYYLIALQQLYQFNSHEHTQRMHHLYQSVCIALFPNMLRHKIRTPKVSLSSGW